MMRMMKLMIVGFGGVASRLAELIDDRREELRSDYLVDLRVVGIADSKSFVSDQNGLDLQRVLQTKRRTGAVAESGSPDLPLLIRETEADVLIELTPTNHKDGEPAVSHFRAAMETGKHVVTANKGPLATAYEEMTTLAAKNGVRLLFGATVGGGNPVLKYGEICASAEPVLGAEAIVNRTSTYILSQMESRGLGFATVLRETQETGLAEPDPSLDVDGIDTACKIVIIANHIIGKKATVRDVHPIESIREVSPELVAGAKTLGKRIRMVGVVNERDLAVRVLEMEQADPLVVYGKSDMTRYECKYSGPKLVGSTKGGPSFTAMGLLREVLEVERGGR